MVLFSRIFEILSEWIRAHNADRDECRPSKGVAGQSTYLAKLKRNPALTTYSDSVWES
jgi:hypothetical protein